MSLKSYITIKRKDNLWSVPVSLCKPRLINNRNAQFLYPLRQQAAQNQGTGDWEQLKEIALPSPTALKSEPGDEASGPQGNSRK